MNSFGNVIVKMNRESRSRSSSRSRQRSSSSSAGSDIQIVDDETGDQGSDDNMLEVVSSGQKDWRGSNEGGGRKGERSSASSRSDSRQSSRSDSHQPDPKRHSLEVGNVDTDELEVIQEILVDVIHSSKDPSVSAMVGGGTADKEDGHDIDTMNKEEGDITKAMDKEETISLTFNGEQRDFTHKAKTHLNVVEETLIPFAEHCESLEENIRKTQKRAIEQADLSSLGTSTEQEPRRKRKLHHETNTEAMSRGGEDTGDILDDLRHSSEEVEDVTMDKEEEAVTLDKEEEDVTLDKEEGGNRDSETDVDIDLDQIKVEDEEILACDLCPKQCYGHKQLSKHKMQAHLDKKEYTCEVCGVCVKGARSFYNHKRNHKKYQCPKCEKHLVIHDKAAHIRKCKGVKDKIRKCEHEGCTFTTERPSHLKKHMETHREVFCDVVGCGKKFHGQKKLNAHKRKEHKPLFAPQVCPKQGPKKEPKIHRCQWCSFQTRFTTHLKDHLNSCAAKKRAEAAGPDEPVTKDELGLLYSLTNKCSMTEFNIILEFFMNKFGKEFFEQGAKSAVSQYANSLAYLHGSEEMTFKVKFLIDLSSLKFKSFDQILSETTCF